MICDFAANCKSYDKNIYTKEYFSGVTCPKCPATGRFTLYGAYFRYVIYFSDGGLIHARLEIKRVKCKSCDSTHAVLPRDIIPYRLLALSAVLFILYKRFIESTPVLRIAAGFDFSYQFVYSVLHTFDRFRNRLILFFKELGPKSAPAASRGELLLKIGAIRPVFRFQFLYMKSNRRPCFMCKFFDALAPPYISAIPPPKPPGGLST